MNWRMEASVVENNLVGFLGLDKDCDVAYMNRGAAAIYAALLKTKLSGGQSLQYEMHNYPAMKHIGTRVFDTNTQPNRYNEEQLIYPDDEIQAPTVLGGAPIYRGYFDKAQYLVYDCAQTCYPNMFEDIEFSDTQFAILSFQQDKPCGSMAGGGAVVGSKKSIDYIRALFIPGTFFYNPRAGQCSETNHVISQPQKRYSNDEKKFKVYGIHLALKEKGFIIPFSHRHKDWDAWNHYTHIYIENTKKKNKLENLFPSFKWEPYASDLLLRAEI